LPPLAGVFAIMAVQLDPLSVVYSSFTFATFVLVHVIFWLEPICQFSPPLGEVSVIVDGKEIVKALSLSSCIDELLTSLPLCLY